MTCLGTYLAPHRSIADQLRRAPVFAALPIDRRECLSVLREGEVFELPAGVEVVSRGDAAALLVVTEGALRDQASGRDWPAGSCLGLAEIAAGRSFSSAIETAVPTLLYRLDAMLLDSFKALCPAVARDLLGSFIDDAHQMAVPG